MNKQNLIDFSNYIKTLKSKMIVDAKFTTNPVPEISFLGRMVALI